MANVTYTAVDGVLLSGDEELATLINNQAGSLVSGALVVDGGFPDDTNWTLGTGWTVPTASVYETAIALDSPAHWLRLGDTSGSVAAVNPIATGVIAGTYTGTVALNQAGLMVNDPDAPSILLSGAGAVLLDASWPTVSSYYSIEVTIKPSTVEAGYHALFAEDGNWGVYLVGNKLSYYKAGLFQSSTVLVAGTIYHIVMTAEAGLVKFYIDGVFDFSTVAVVANGEVSNVGYDPTPSPTDYFKGNMQDIIVFEGTLSATQVANHFAATGL